MFHEISQHILEIRKLQKYRLQEHLQRNKNQQNYEKRRKNYKLSIEKRLTTCRFSIKKFESTSTIFESKII
jgi:hypothetical protein